MSFEKHVILYMCMFAWCLAMCLAVCAWRAACISVCLSRGLPDGALFVFESASVYVHTSGIA